MKEANEVQAFYMSEAEALEDRARFIENLGWLLSQTRTGVKYCRLVNRDLAAVSFGEGEILINIAMDSYAAAVIDIVKSIL